MILVYSVALGFGIEPLIEKVFKPSDPIHFLNSYLLYYLAFEFVLRYMMQNLPVLDIQPYRHLPVKKTLIAHYLLGRSLFNVLNVSVPLTFLPFTFMVIAPAYGPGAATAWLVSLWLLSFALHFVVFLMKKSDDDLVSIITVTAVFGVFALADYFNWFQLTSVSAFAFDGLIDNPSLIIIPVLLLALVYVFNYRMLLTGMYEEDYVKKKSADRQVNDFTFLRSFGELGELINIEIKLITRNKRTKSVLWLSLFFLFYGLIFYRGDTYKENMPGFLIFTGIFITGIFAINYGQFLFSWHSSHFDFFLAQPLGLKSYVQYRYYLLATVTTVSFVLSTPYLYFGWKVLLAHACTYLYNIGINIWLVMNIGMWSPKKIDLTKGASFNYEGTGAAQWLMSIPILAGPYLFYMPVRLTTDSVIAGYLAVGAAGLIGLLFMNKLMDFTAKRLIEKRHEISSGFRQD